jgi:FKBP-type peptidyl-prolyl cis-trans isomerase FklB
LKWVDCALSLKNINLSNVNSSKSDIFASYYQNKQMEKVSYALGVSVAQSLQGSGVDSLNDSEFMRGFQHAFGASQMEMSAAEVNMLLQSYFTNLQHERQAKNGVEGQAFLEANRSNEGVVELQSGLQYLVMNQGEGECPKATDKVRCHYHGTLIDGTVFDSSVERGTPAVFPVNGVIQGWVEALQLMAVGSKWRLFIPPHLAYGDQGAGDRIGPQTTLVFDVELLGIE